MQAADWINERSDVMPATVTVLMSVYNGMPFLPEAVDSILNQTLQDFAFLIINDGSTDGSGEYLGQLDDPRVQLIHQPQKGLGAALNTGLAACETEFLARMDADDVSEPTRLEAQLSFLHSHQEVGMVGTQFVYFGAGGRTVFSPRMPCDHETIYRDLLAGRLSLVHASLMFRMRILRGIGGYRVEGMGEDWDMFLRVGEVTRLANLEDVLYRWRIHSSGVKVSEIAERTNGVEYGLDCGRRRAAGRPELTFDEFLLRRLARPFWERAVEAMDLHAEVQYRRALFEITNSQWRGYARLLWAASCSPQRTTRRIVRLISARARPRG